MNKKRLIISLLLFMMIAATISFWPGQQAAATGPDTAVAPLAAQNLQTSPSLVIAEGETIPNYYVNLAFQAGGEVVDMQGKRLETVQRAMNPTPNDQLRPEEPDSYQ